MSKYVFEAEKAHPSAWIAPGAVVVGDVHLGEDSSVWFNAVLRGDTATITVGARSNIQDLTMVHADPGFPAWIGTDVTVGHRAIVHGATVSNGSLVGMGAILLNGVQVGEQCLIAAGSVLTQGKIFPPRTLILGSPAKVVRELNDDDLMQLAASAAHYVRKAKEYQVKGKEGER
jgi:carbonic anhydrase/acetyltransferase-like protein (isoleucine patch superfamily)